MMVVAGSGSAAVAGRPQLDRWIYLSRNLWVDQNIVEIGSLFDRAARAGYNKVLLADSKFSKLDDMDARYFRNLARVKEAAARLRLEIVPALFPIGYSNDLLWHDPNLIEALPVRDASFVVNGGLARPIPEPAMSLKGGDFSDLGRWDWKDANMVADAGSVRVTDPKGQNARISQKLKLVPFHQYHISVRVKTDQFVGTPEVKILAAGRALNYASLGVKRTQDWTTHHVVFNSLDNAEGQLYLGCWGGSSGSLWFDDAAIEDAGLLNLVRRDGAPFTVRAEDDRVFLEGTDFERVSDPRMGTIPWKGSYEVWHEPPAIKTFLPDGTKLRVSFYHAITVNEDQAMICPSEPRTVELLRDQARRMHAAWNAHGYMMSHDEIRVLNWCDACQRRQLGAGALLADNARTCIRILREVNPGGEIYVWSDIFDPNHNAHRDYYLVNGDLTGSWEGLYKDVIVVPWYFEKRNESLKWFADRGHRQVIAGYYDSPPQRVQAWLDAANKVSGVGGVIYTTWQNRYADLEAFGKILSGGGLSTQP